jgi:hypothetical protein
MMRQTVIVLVACLLGAQRLPAGDLVLHSPEINRKAASELSIGKMYMLKLVSVDSTEPTALATANKLFLAPGDHRIVLRGRKVVITGFSMSMGAQGQLLDAGATTEEEAAEVTLAFATEAGGRYKLSCDREATCTVQDRQKKTVSREEKKEETKEAPKEAAAP